MRKLILFDIDKTLIDTHKLWDKRRLNLIKVLGVSGKQIKKVEKGHLEYPSRTDNFEPREFILRLSKSFNKDMSQIEKAFYKKNAYIEALFPEIITTLENYSEKFILGVFSEGDFVNQMAKLTQSEIIKYFDKNNIFIFQRKREDVSIRQLPQEAILIDDNVGVLNTINEKTNIDCIWINRLDNKPHPKFKTVFNLNELNKFVN